MKYFAVEYRVQGNIMCSFDSEIDLNRWIHDGNQDGTFREQVTDIEVGAMFVHHVTYTRITRTVSLASYTPEYDPPLEF